MDDREIGFVCKNSCKFYAEGKLKLAAPFLIEYGSSIKEKVYFEMPSGEIWFGKYVKGSEYVEGLSQMMSFYGVRPYHIVLLNFSGDDHFKLRIFNECGVEICYPFSCPSSSHLRARRNDPFFLGGNMKLDGTEIDKLASTFTFNVLHNFRGVHEILILKDHLTLQRNYKVISSSDFKKLGMHEGVKSMEFCFEQNSWQIGFLWKKGCLFFDNGWYEFVKSAKIVEGDICVVAKTAAADKFKIAVLPKLLLTQWSLTSDTNRVEQRFSWVKILKGSSLDRGSVEIPLLFARRLGRELGSQIQFLTSDGRVFHGRYSFSENLLYGLMDMISAYDIYKNCLIVFEFVGNSTFNVSIFDSLNMDHLKDITGEFISDILRKIEMEEAEADNATEDENEDLHGNSLVAENNAAFVFEVDDDVTVLENEEHDDILRADDVIELDVSEGEEQIVGLNEQFDLAGAASNCFVVTLKKSHVDEKSHGVYCSTRCYELYKGWNGGRIVVLNYRGDSSEVVIQRKKRSCRFGRGWDDFIRKGELQEGQKLEFRFTIPYHLHVSEII